MKVRFDHLFYFAIALVVIAKIGLWRVSTTFLL